MNRVLLLGIIGAILGGGVGSLMALSDDGKNAMFLASELPLTVDQVRAKLQAEGWAAIQVTRDDRYIEATASRDGRIGHLMVDSLTGQLITDDLDDD